jgi:hypothetical protein
MPISTPQKVTPIQSNASLTLPSLVPQLTVKGPFGFLNNGVMDANLDQLPVAYMSLAAFCSIWSSIAAYSPHGWYYGSIPGISPMNAMAACWSPGGNSPIDQVALFMAPSQVSAWATVCLKQLGVTNCPNPGPIVGPLQTQGFNFQYVAVTANLQCRACFNACLNSVPWGPWLPPIC